MPATTIKKIHTMKTRSTKIPINLPMDEFFADRTLPTLHEAIKFCFIGGRKEWTMETEKFRNELTLLFAKNHLDVSNVSSKEYLRLQALCRPIWNSKFSKLTIQKRKEMFDKFIEEERKKRGIIL